MIGRVYAIALNTFREAIRNRVLYGIVAAVIGLNLFAIVMGEMSVHEEARIARDVGLAGVSLFGSLTAIFLGVSLLYGEIQRRTIHTILSKPIERYEFVLGKYAGMGMSLTILVVLFTLTMMGLLYLQDVPMTSAVLKGVVLSYIEVLIVAGIALFFSSFSTPFLSGIFTFALFCLGRLSADMRGFADTADAAWMRGALDVGLWIVPDLGLFSVSAGTVEGKYVSVHSDFVSWGYVTSAAGYGALYLGMLLAGAMLIFSRRDFS